MALPSPLLTVPNETAHPSVASVPNIALLYDGPLLCGFTVAIKGFKSYRQAVSNSQEAQLSLEGRAMLHVAENLAVTQVHSKLPLSKPCVSFLDIQRRTMVCPRNLR